MELAAPLHTHRSKNNDPAQCGLGYKAEDYVGLLAICVDLPLTYLLVLQEHVDGEGIEEDKGEKEAELCIDRNGIGDVIC